MSLSDMPVPPGPWEETASTVALPPGNVNPPVLVIPGYQVVRRLGGGGMGDVYEVVDERLGVTLALKIVRPDRASEAFTRRFRQEVRAMMGLDHPRIARVYGHSELNGRPYFTMKFVRGGTLADCLPAVRDRPRDAVQLLLKIIDAVDYMHRQGQVHRDLKPSNVLLDESGEPFLSDFGLVKDLADPGDSGAEAAPTSPALADPTPGDAETRTIEPAHAGGHHRTKTGAQLGTIAYMSPEQSRGEVRRVGPGSDIWALGVILRELLTGRRPNPGETVPGQVADPELDRIIRRCLAEEPTARYPTAAALAADLRTWLDRPRARRRRLVLVTAAVLVLAGGVTIYLAMLRPRTPPDPVAEWRARARADLRAGREVVLVDRDGDPAPGARFLAGEAASKMGREPDGWWAVHTTEGTLVEFLDDPGIDAFELSGQMRPITLSNLPRIGLVVAHRQVPTTGGDWHFQVEHLYKENGNNFLPEPPAGPPQADPPNTRVIRPVEMRAVGPPPVRVIRGRACRFGATGNIPITLDGHDIDADARAVGGPWRSLSILARPDGFAAAWDGKDAVTVREFTTPELARMQGVLDGRLDPPLRFTARGGLGVIVEGGGAAFRNVVLRPVP
jgi:Protein kinase domain